MVAKVAAQNRALALEIEPLLTWEQGGALEGPSSASTRSGSRGEGTGSGQEQGVPVNHAQDPRNGRQITRDGSRREECPKGYRNKKVKD